MFMMDELRRRRADVVGEAAEQMESSKRGMALSSKEQSDNEALSSRYIAYLRSIKDNWSSCHAARLLTPALLVYIHQRFLMLSTPLKVRVLTSFLYLRPALVRFVFHAFLPCPSPVVSEDRTTLPPESLPSWVQIDSPAAPPEGLLPCGLVRIKPKDFSERVPVFFVCGSDVFPVTWSILPSHIGKHGGRCRYKERSSCLD